MISIIVPVFNAEKYLRQCINSILGQSYRDIELILVNDGSTDSSLTIARGYGVDDDRVVILTQDNAGVSEARNRGLDMAKGDYIMFVDSDDVLMSDTLEVLLANITKDRTDIATCSLAHVRGDIGVESEYSRGSKTARYVGTGKALGMLLYQEGIVAGPVCKLFKKALFDEVRYKKGLKFAEDLDVSYRTLAISNGVSMAPFTGYLYRVHVESAMHKPFSLSRMAGLVVCRDILESARSAGSDVVSAAENRLFMEAVYIYLQIPVAKAFRYKSNIKELNGVIRKYRMKVLFDKRNTLTTSRVYALLSLFGLPSIVFGGAILRRIKGLM